MGMGMLTSTPQPGLPVYTTDGRRLGKIKSVSATTLTIARRFRRDLHLPLTHVGRVFPGDSTSPPRVTLALASYEVKSHCMDPTPELTDVHLLPDPLR